MSRTITRHPGGVSKLTLRLPAPAVSEKSDVPVLRAIVGSARQPAFDRGPEALDVPLDVDVVLEDQRGPVPVLEHAFQRARLAPVGRDDALVDLADGLRLEGVPQELGDVQVRVRGAERGVAAAGAVEGLEMGDPVRAGVVRRRRDAVLEGGQGGGEGREARGGGRVEAAGEGRDPVGSGAHPANLAHLGPPRAAHDFFAQFAGLAHAFCDPFQEGLGAVGGVDELDVEGEGVCEGADVGAAVFPGREGEDVDAVKGEGAAVAREMHCRCGCVFELAAEAERVPAEVVRRGEPCRPFGGGSVGACGCSLSLYEPVHGPEERSGEETADEERPQPGPRRRRRCRKAGRRLRRRLAQRRVAVRRRRGHAGPARALAQGAMVRRHSDRIRPICSSSTGSSPLSPALSRSLSAAGSARHGAQRAA